MLDLGCIEGNASSPAVLKKAGAEDADLLIAVTQSDQTNLCACKIAASLFNISTRIARIRSADYMDYPELFSDSNFAVDYIISPEQVVTEYIEKLIEFPEALQVFEFANGKVSLVAVSAVKGGPLVGHPIADIHANLPDIDTRITAIYRQGQSINVEGNTIIHESDEVFFLAATEDIRQVMKQLRNVDKAVKRIMIAGGGNIGLRLAKTLENDYQVKVIERNLKRAEYIATELSESLVIQGDVTDEELLENENIDCIDMFLALTNDDEDNIMSATLAKRMKARRVLALINRAAYVDLVQAGPIDIALSPAQVSIGKLLAHVRRGDVQVVHSLKKGASEAMELVVHGDYKTSKVIGRKIEDIHLPVGANIGALVRKVYNPHDSQFEEKVLIAHHDTVVEAGDHVILLIATKRLIPKVEKLFQVSVGFF